MPEIEITEECRALIAAEFPFEETVRRQGNGEWQMQIDAETLQRLQKVRRQGETISDCIIRVIIVTQQARRAIIAARIGVSYFDENSSSPPADVRSMTCRPA